MSEDRGLTGIEEIMRGFVGGRGISHDPTKKGRKRVRLDLCRGDTDLESLTFPTWRHCVGYDDIADYLKDVKQGDLLKVTGYVVSGIKKISGKPVFLITGEPVVEDTIIIKTAVYMRHVPGRPRLFEYSPSGVNTSKVDPVASVAGH